MDNSEDVCGFLFSLIAGTFLLVDAILIHTGKYRSWWAVRHYTAGQEPFVVFPAALFCLGAFLAWVSPMWLRPVFAFLAIGGVLSALFFLAARPRFLKPAWLQWLEDNYGPYIPTLRKEARKMGAQEWGARVRTQEGLEQWVAEVLKKHGLTEQDPPQQ